MSLPAWLQPKMLVHYAVLVVTGVATFAPQLPYLQPLLPATAYHLIVVACATALWLMQSPLFKPLLPTKTPEQEIAGAKSRAADISARRQSTIPPPAP
jgi:hypothetical protein